jgi:glucose-1-phosphate cytidylyltransferase
MNLDFTIKIQNESQLISHGKLDEEDWEVTVADTGADTMTGGRLLKIQKYVGDSTFFCTYGDGLASVDLKKLLDFHKSHGKIATLTTVQPQSRFGILDLDEGSKVLRFKEKPLVQSWINAGFFVFEPEIFGYLDSNSVLESGPLNKLAEEGELMAFKHEGFWQPMDTYRESQALNEMWQSEVIPWKMWN